MKISFKAKSDLDVAKEQEAKLKEKLAAIEKERKELEDRTRTTPVMRVENEPKAPMTPPPVPPPPAEAAAAPSGSTPEEEELKADLEYLFKKYGGAFGELGPSAHQEVVRTLLLGIFCELLEKK